MAVKFKPKFTENDLRNFIRKKVQIIEDTLLDLIKQTAEQFISDARSTQTYQDRTRNLRGSIGYVIVKDGEEIFGNFEGVAEGTSQAKLLTSEVKSEHPRGYVLIVVAGMNYAVYVESKGFDVLTGSSQLAEQDLQRSFDRLKEQLKKF